MKLPRRQFLSLTAGAVALPIISPVAKAQAYPTRPVRIVVGFAAGGAADITARLLGQSLSEQFAQQFIVENRPVAGGNVATEAVIAAPADGYTLLLVTPANATNATLYERLNHNFLRDIAPTASINRDASVMVVNLSVPAKTVPEFIAYAKSNPGKVNMSSGGIGTTQHVAGELFKMLTGIDMVHVPYRGGAPALADLIGGQVQVMFATMASSIEYIRSGKLRPLGMTTANRSPALPDVPVISDFVRGYEASGVYGFGVRRSTPGEIINRLNAAINAAITNPKMQERLAELGSTALPGSPADFEKLMSDETEKWSKVIKFAGIKVE
jgi:tripartite-type tricarboxylate transporter receptor subunit TctC